METFFGSYVNLYTNSRTDFLRQSTTEKRERSYSTRIASDKKKDPDLVYEMELKKLQKGMLEGRENDAKKHSIIAFFALVHYVEFPCVTLLSVSHFFKIKTK